MTSSTFAKLEPDSLPPSFTGAGVETGDGGGVAIGAQKMPTYLLSMMSTAYKATANNSTVGILSISNSLN